MKHLKKFENSSSRKFELSEIADIINEIADVFDIEEVDDIFMIYWSAGERTINLDDLKKEPKELEKMDDIAIHIPYETNIDDDFTKNCNDYIVLFKNLIALSGKLETFDCEIAPDSFWIDFDMNQIKFTIYKI
jgi:hypothetical protein